MAKMMTYLEANTILESSLTPNGRCICKKTAIDNHAVASNLTAYVDNRLVPASMVVLITYSIQFKDWDGTVLSTQTVRYGHTPTLPSNPSRTGYTFTGWSNNPNTAPSADTVYTALYTINSYTATFKDWDNTTLKTQSVNYGSSATPPSNPSRTGYTFTGWSPSNMTITSDTTFTAQYSINSFTVTFLDDNGGVFSTLTVSYGGYASAPSSSPTKTGYTFAGWSPNPASTPITSNTTFSPTWNYINYTVTFKIRRPGETSYEILSKKLDYHYGDTIIVPTVPQFSGYVFSGWLVYVPATVTGDLETFGYYDPDTTTIFTMTWYYNGGTDQYGDTVEYKTSTKQYGSSFESDVYRLVWNGAGSKTFNGWQGAPADGTPVYQDYTMYALWRDVLEEETFTVEYILWTQTSPNPTSELYYVEYNVAYGSSVPTPPNTPSKPGYRFNGWSWNGSAIPSTVTRDLTITGSLIPTTEPQKYNVSFWIAQEYVPSAGRNVELQRLPYEMGETVTCPSNPYTSETDATFEGWSVNGLLLQPGDTFLCTGEDDYWASYSTSGGGGGGELTTLYTITWEDPYALYLNPSTQTEQVAEGTTPSMSLPSASGYTFSWSPTPYPANQNQTYTLERTETEIEKTVSFYLEYRNVNTPAQAISGSISAHAGGWGASGSLTPGNGCTLSCSNSADWEYDVYGTGEINGESITFSDMPWNSSMTFFVEDYVTIGGNEGGGGTGGDDPNDNPTDTPNEPVNPGGGTNDDGGGGSNLEGGEQQGSGGAGQGNSGNQGGQETYEEDPNVNPGGNEGGGNTGGNTGGNSGSGTDDDDDDPDAPMID